MPRQSPQVRHGQTRSRCSTPGAAPSACRARDNQSPVAACSSAESTTLIVSDGCARIRLPRRAPSASTIPAARALAVGPRPGSIAASQAGKSRLRQAQTSEGRTACVIRHEPQRTRRKRTSSPPRERS